MASSSSTTEPAQEDMGPSEIFEKVYNRFRMSLDDEDKRDFNRFSDCETMLRHAKQAYDAHLIRNTRLDRFYEQLGDLATKLSPYFDMVGIYAQVKPEILCIVWGSLRFIFQIGLNYASFAGNLAVMFEQISSCLGPVESYVSSLKQWQNSFGNPLPIGVVKALSCVYVDLIQFCQDICRLFMTKKGSRFQTFAIIRDLGWKPFDLRFSDFLRNFGRHTKNLRDELSLHHASTVLREFELLRSDIRRTERQIQTLESKLMGADAKTRLTEDERAGRIVIRNLIQWINPPGWQQAFEDAINGRLDGTCEWFFKDMLCSSWICQTSGTEYLRPLLLVQGKPGYGKTHLCARLIEHLRRNSENPATGSSSVAFYFFNRRAIHACQPIDAFRALLVQLLQAHKSNRNIIDLACIAKRNSEYPDADAIELKATTDDVLNLMNIILQHLEGTTLILDGVDECSDLQKFFDYLLKITSRPSVCRDNVCSPETSRFLLDTLRVNCAIFGRQGLKVPAALLGEATLVELKPQHNCQDIMMFLGRALQRLVEEDLLDKGLDLTQLSISVANRADGMFLWASLLVQYLECDIFTPEDRMEALRNLVLVEGLDRLYHAILLILQKRLPASGRKAVRRAFLWVAGARRPLHISEFAVAIAIEPSAKYPKMNAHKDLDKTLARMSGSLLEISTGLYVRFVHTSVKEYLLGEMADSEYQPAEEFRLCNERIHGNLAKFCLHYIGMYIPAGPLSGSAQITPQESATIQRYPLLSYAASSWIYHSSETFQIPPSMQVVGGREGSIFSDILENINCLLDSKELVTTWIEASWLFGSPPDFSDLVFRIQKFMLSSLANGVQTLTESVIAKLWLLSADVAQLKSAWSTVLAQLPNEIWQPSITNYTTSEFWPKVRGATWKRLKFQRDKGLRGILIASQVSEDGQELGVIKLKVPSDKLDLSRYDPQCFRGWQSSFEVWSLATSKVLFKATFDLEPDAVRKVVSEAGISYMETDEPRLRDLEFQFPVAFGPQFRSLILLDHIVDIQGVPALEAEPQAASCITFTVTKLASNITATSPGTRKLNLLPPNQSCLASLTTGSSAPNNEMDLSKTEAELDAPLTQRSNQLTIWRNSEGINEASMLHVNESAVVLQTASEVGTQVQAQLLASIPRELSTGLQPILINNVPVHTPNPSSLRIVWVKDKRRWYSFDEGEEEEPVTLEREKSSISTISMEVKTDKDTLPHWRKRRRISQLP